MCFLLYSFELKLIVPKNLFKLFGSREICKGQIIVLTVTKISSALLCTANPG